MKFRCYTAQLSAHAIPVFRHVVFPVRCDVVQHILQAVKLVMVKHTDGIDGYLLRGNPAVAMLVSLIVPSPSAWTERR